MPSITMYGGVNEIGGNKLLLEDRGTRIFLDFGKSFGARSLFYEWTEKPRLANGVGDFLSIGLLPDLSGLYREDLLRLAGLPVHEDRLVDAVVLSHAHADHADYVSFLREDIPIYMGATTKDIIESLEEERNADIEFEITSFKKRYSGNKKEPAISRDIRTFSTSSKEFALDSISIEPIHVDHSLPGCYAFIVHTGNATLVYSGDLRAHGAKAEMTKEFVERASKARPDIMLCEGTRIAEASSASEMEVFGICKHYVEQGGNSHFVFADFSYKDIDRFITFYNIAKLTNRKLLISARTARYLRALGKRETSLKIPSIQDEHLIIFQPRVKSGRYEESDYDSADREIITKYNVWTADDVRKHISQVIMTLGSNHIDDLIDIRPTEGIYLHSASEPHNEEGEIDEARINNWTQKFGLCKVHAHSSGHASGVELNQMINAIQPKVLVPMHTEHPEMFRIFHGGRVKLTAARQQLSF